MDTTHFCSHILEYRNQILKENHFSLFINGLLSGFFGGVGGGGGVILVWDRQQ